MNERRFFFLVLLHHRHAFLAPCGSFLGLFSTQAARMRRDCLPCCTKKNRRGQRKAGESEIEKQQNKEKLHRANRAAEFFFLLLLLRPQAQISFPSFSARRRAEDVACFTFAGRTSVLEAWNAEGEREREKGRTRAAATATATMAAAAFFFFFRPIGEPLFCALLFLLKSRPCLSR